MIDGYEAVPLQEQPSQETTRAELLQSATTRKRPCLFAALAVVVLMMATVHLLSSMAQNEKDDSWAVTIAFAIAYLRPGETSPEWQPAKVSPEEEELMIMNTTSAYREAIHWTDEHDAFTLPQSEWRLWLDEHPVVEGYDIKEATFWRTGCGTSMRMKFGGDQAHKAFLKYSVTKDKDHYTAEFHHREITSAYLDRVMGTEVVPPAVGHRFWYEDLEESLPGKFEKEVLAENTYCGRTSDEFLDASVMLYLDNVTMSTKFAVERAARAFDTSSQKEDDNELNTSAIHYAIFHYLAGCMKSGHNHFLYQDKRFVAIDNDRCFTPERLINAKYVRSKDFERFHTWVAVLFETCQFPEHLVQRLEKATREDAGDRRLSSQLKAALREDPLSDQLLRLQPESFDDLDRRAAKLMEHIRSCRQRQV